jgi:hypothetical protein
MISNDCRAGIWPWRGFIVVTLRNFSAWKIRCTLLASGRPSLNDRVSIGSYMTRQVIQFPTGSFVSPSPCVCDKRPGRWYWNRDLAYVYRVYAYIYILGQLWTGLSPTPNVYYLNRALPFRPCLTSGLSSLSVYIIYKGRHNGWVLWECYCEVYYW